MGELPYERDGVLPGSIEKTSNWYQDPVLRVPILNCPIFFGSQYPKRYRKRSLCGIF